MNEHMKAQQITVWEWMFYIGFILLVLIIK